MPHLVYKAVCFNKIHRVPKKNASRTCLRTIGQICFSNSRLQWEMGFNDTRLNFKISDVLAHLPTNGIFFFFYVLWNITC